MVYLLVLHTRTEIKWERKRNRILQDIQKKKKKEERKQKLLSVDGPYLFDQDINYYYIAGYDVDG